MAEDRIRLVDPAVADITLLVPPVAIRVALVRRLVLAATRVEVVRRLVRVDTAPLEEVPRMELREPMKAAVELREATPGLRQTLKRAHLATAEGRILVATNRNPLDLLEVKPRVADTLDPADQVLGTTQADTPVAILLAAPPDLEGIQTEVKLAPTMASREVMLTSREAAETTTRATTTLRVQPKGSRQWNTLAEHLMECSVGLPLVM